MPDPTTLAATTVTSATSVDADAVRRALVLVCRHAALLGGGELAALRALLARQEGSGNGRESQPAAVEPPLLHLANRTAALAAAALAILDTDYHRHEISSAAVARRLRVSHWHLSRVLRHATGASFLAHLHQRRTAAAARLLAARGDALSIKEIAYQSGYANTRELGRRFRRATGMTPGEYRRLSRTLTAGAEEQQQFLLRVS